MDNEGKKQRRNRVDSTQEQMRIMQGAAREISPPPYIDLNEGELIIFNNIIDEKARADWTDHQIDLACALARHTFLLLKSSALLSKEGEIYKDARGNIKVNPRKRQIENSWVAIISARRNLGIHARGLGGELRDIAKRQDMQKELENLITDDDFLAKPDNDPTIN